jgi:very-short-patch-repair endonuclease
VHWEDRAVDDRGTLVSVGLIDALRVVIECEKFETAVAALDWAIHTRALDEIDFETLILEVPHQYRGIRDWVDRQCESLPESLSRTRLRLAGHKVTSQVPLGEVQRIDLVVDDLVAIEVDGEEHHWNRFEADRAKDVDISLCNLHAMRPSARMVFSNWEKFEAAVEMAVRARRPGHENSGNVRRSPFASPGVNGWRRHRRDRIPEFPLVRRQAATKAGNSSQSSARWPLRE